MSLSVDCASPAVLCIMLWNIMYCEFPRNPVSQLKLSKVLNSRHSSTTSTTSVYTNNERDNNVNMVLHRWQVVARRQGIAGHWPQPPRQAIGSIVACGAHSRFRDTLALYNVPNTLRPRDDVPPSSAVHFTEQGWYTRLLIY